MSILKRVLLTCLLSGSTTVAFAGLELKSIEHEICGPKLYKQKSAAPCPEIYLNKRTRTCGVSRYKHKPNKACPGYQAQETFTNKHHCSGHPTLERLRDTSECRTSGAGRDRVEVCETVRRFKCERKPEIIQSCRRKEHGPDQYKSCRHVSHGIESYKSCRHQSFGVESYNACQMYMTPMTVNGYLEGIRSSMESVASLQSFAMTNFAFDSGNNTLMACTVKALAGYTQFQAAVEDLTSKYRMAAGVDYSPEHCVSGASIPSIANFECESEPDSRLCESARKWRDANSWFTETLADLALLSGDLPARKDPGLKGEIVALMDLMKATSDKLQD